MGPTQKGYITKGPGGERMGFTAQVVSLVSCGIRDRSSVLMGGGGRGC